jgi:predicted N-acetyltransferase YhbS
MLTIIRPEEPRDVPALELVTIEAFKLAPQTDHTEEFIVRELRLANALTVSLVAEANEHISVNTMTDAKTFTCRRYGAELKQKILALCCCRLC